jgi:GT2 family glycosyltransferase
MHPRYDQDSYILWANEHDTLTNEDQVRIRNRIENLPRIPLLSVVLTSLPTISDSDDLHALACVQAQLYPYWELFVWNSSLLGQQDPRIIRIDVPPPDLGTLYNAALPRVSGEFIVMLSPDMCLPPHTFFELALVITSQPRVNLIYTDEDRIDEAGRPCAPYFKADWDPDLLLGRDAVGAIAALRTEKVRQIGGMRAGLSFDMCQYDMILRLSAVSTPLAFYHIPAVLCSRPASHDASAWDAEEARSIVRKHLSRLGQAGVIVVPAFMAPNWNRIIYPIPAPPPLASVVIPVRDRSDLLKRCVEGILSHTTYPSFELIIVDNGSCEEDTLMFLEVLRSDPRVSIISSPGPFNYSALNNEAIEKARGDIIILLNNDTIVISENWMSELVSQALRSDVGIVGAKLLYADGRVQHCGFMLGPNDALSHQLRLASRADPGPDGELALVRSVSAVTGACMAFRKSVFIEIGRLNETDFRVAFNDVDLCLRAGDFGYRVICTPFAELFHLESATRGYDDTPEKLQLMTNERKNFLRLWRWVVNHDPYHNPNLVFGWDSTHLANPPRRERPWYIEQTETAEARIVSDVTDQEGAAFLEPASDAHMRELSAKRAADARAFADAAIEKVHTQLRNLEAELTSVQARSAARIRDLENQVDQLEGERTRSSARLEDFRNQVTVLKSEVQRVTAAYNAVLSSTAWRLTSPVRRLGSILPTSVRGVIRAGLIAGLKRRRAHD